MPKHWKVTYQGQTKNLMDWSRLLNKKYITLHKRLIRGWAVNRAFRMPRIDPSISGGFAKDEWWKRERKRGL